MRKNILLIILFCLFLLIFLLLFSYKTALFFTTLTPPQENTLNYLHNPEELQLNYTSSELSHLKDVQNIMKMMDYLFYFSLLVCTLIVTFYRKKKEKLSKLFLYGGSVTVTLVILILLSSLISFNVVFTLFHRIFFPQGNWTFPAESLLIQIFPEGFFMKTGRIIFLMTLFLGSIFITLSIYLKNVHQSGRS